MSHLLLPVEQHQLAVCQDAVFPLPCCHLGVGGLATGQSVGGWSFHIWEQKTTKLLARGINHLLCFHSSAVRSAKKPAGLCLVGPVSAFQKVKWES